MVDPPDCHYVVRTLLQGKKVTLKSYDLPITLVCHLILESFLTQARIVRLKNVPTLPLVSNVEYQIIGFLELKHILIPTED